MSSLSYLCISDRSGGAAWNSAAHRLGSYSCPWCSQGLLETPTRCYVRGHTQMHGKHILPHTAIPRISYILCPCCMYCCSSQMSATIAMWITPSLRWTPLTLTLSCWCISAMPFGPMLSLWMGRLLGLPVKSRSLLTPQSWPRRTRKLKLCDSMSSLHLHYSWQRHVVNDCDLFYMSVMRSGAANIRPVPKIKEQIKK